VENGDFNWIVPGKLLAVCSPTSVATNDGDTVTHPPSYYTKYFKENGIDTIVRLCKVEYDATDFVKAGINHFDMYFIDGTTPSIEIVHRFLKVAEEAKGVAVHCKQGLGRTGTLLACYLMKHHGFAADESIAFLRIQRPGSVVGPQQAFLHDVQHLLQQPQTILNAMEEELKLKKRSSTEAQISVLIPMKSSKLQKTEETKTKKAQPARKTNSMRVSV